jgi:hypothetical protein
MPSVRLRDARHNRLEVRGRQPFRRQAAENAVAPDALARDDEHRAQAIAPALQDKPLQGRPGGVLAQAVEIDVGADGIPLS